MIENEQIHVKKKKNTKILHSS